MFTGLVEEVGVIRNIKRDKGLLELEINTSKVIQDLKREDSVNINGVCLTVVNVTHSNFKVQVVRETIEKTTLNFVKSGMRVNLERALQPSSRIGGHFVLGHVDGTGEVVSVQQQKGNRKIKIRLPAQFMKYIIPVGSICIDGVSLTVAEIEKNVVTIAVIPFTLEMTTLGNLRKGTMVNVELDMLGKHIVRYIDISGGKR